MSGEVDESRRRPVSDGVPGGGEEEGCRFSKLDFSRPSRPDLDSRRGQVRCDAPGADSRKGFPNSRSLVVLPLDDSWPRECHYSQLGGVVLPLLVLGSIA